MNCDIECVQCERDYEAGTGDGWSFVNVPWNCTAKSIVRAHERTYRHNVRVGLYR